MNSANSRNGRNVRNVKTNTSRSSSTSAAIRIFASILFVILALVALYYLYKYLFGKPTGSSVSLSDFNGPQKISSTNGVITPSGSATNSTQYNYTNSKSKYQFSPITAGAQYSVSLWVYITGFAPGTAKPILSIGGGTDGTNDTLRIYLDSTSNILHVRTGSASMIARQTEYTKADNNNGSGSCDIPNFEYQRWVHVTVVLNTRTTDVFLDGKLARSCVNKPYQVHASATLTVNEAFSNSLSGIDGYLSNIVTYNYALSPDEIYRNYMTGPEASYSVWSYLLSFFNPSAYGEGVTKTIMV